MSSSNPKTKSAKVIALLNRSKGAGIDEIGKATGWKPHSCRAFLTGLRKKGHSIIRAKRKDGTSCYRIESAAQPNPASRQQAKDTA